MNIGLIDVDSHNFPSLPLMKISAYHKSLGDDVELLNPFKHYDRVYVAKVFTNTPDYIYKINADEVMKGGTGYNNKNVLPEHIENIYPDYSLFPNLTKNAAYGFLTRGCPRNCKFCIVSSKEGICSHTVASLDMFWKKQNIINLLDPNILASVDHEIHLYSLAESKACINFTQGLDIRLCSKDVIKRILNINIKTIHFAWDSMKDSEKIISQLKLFKENTPYDKRKVIVYVLTNFDTTISDDIYRIQTIRDIGYTPFIMIYDKHGIVKHNRKHRTRSISLELGSWTNQPNFFYKTSFIEYLKFRGITEYTEFREHVTLKELSSIR